MLALNLLRLFIGIAAFGYKLQSGRRNRVARLVQWYSTLFRFRMERTRTFWLSYKLSYMLDLGQVEPTRKNEQNAHGLAVSTRQNRLGRSGPAAARRWASWSSTPANGGHVRYTGRWPAVDPSSSLDGLGNVHDGELLSLYIHKSGRAAVRRLYTAI